MAIHIVTDSPSDLSGEAKELNIHVIPMRVIFDDGVYWDGVDLTPHEFYQKQASAEHLPRTSQVNPEEYCRVFQPLLENGDEVVAILMSSKLSGTFQSATIAKGLLDGGERLHLVDSLNITLAEGLLVKIAVRLRDAGKSAEEIASTVESLKHRVKLLAFISTLKYLKMGGRISASTAMLGGMLNISPVVSVIDGEVKSIGRIRGKQKGYQSTLQYIEHYPIDRNYPVIFGHAEDPDTMEAYRDKCVEALDLQDYGCGEVGTVIGTYSGPGCYGLAYIEQA